VLPALQLGDPERHDVGIVEDRAAALQRGQQQPVHLRERPLDARAVGPARERQRLPRKAVESELLPHLLELLRVARGEQPFQRSGEPTEVGDGSHIREGTPPKTVVHMDLENRVEILVKPLGNVALPLEPA
jgi:hypothetical protein